MWFLLVVGGDGNPVLAAEPMFHGETPGGGLSWFLGSHLDIIHLAGHLLGLFGQAFVPDE